MKKMMMAIICTAFLAQANAQEQKIMPPDCPPGTRTIFVYNITTFNFHKPRTDCTSGFGLCIRGTFGFECWDYFRGAATAIENGKVKGWGEVKGNQLELHLPLELPSALGLEKEEWTNFSVDSGSITVYRDGVKKVSRQGDFPVSTGENDLVVTLELE